MFFKKIIGIAFVVSMLTACGGADATSAPTTGGAAQAPITKIVGDMTVNITTNPSPAVQGPLTIALMVKGVDDKPIEGATVSFKMDMSTMQMADMTGTASDEGGGRYVIRTDFDHPGTVRVSMTIDRSGQSAQGQFEFTVK